MKYFIDTEFAETGGSENPTIDLISIGISAEDGREYYAECSEYDEANCNDWVKVNVLPLLSLQGIPSDIIRDEIVEFVGDDDMVEFWAYYGDYDWVVFCWLFGNMAGLPSNFPQMCMDLQQWWIQLGRPDIKPEQHTGKHNALDDARWNHLFYLALLRWSRKAGQ